MIKKLCLLLGLMLGSSACRTTAMETDLAELAAANNSFAFKLLKQLSAARPRTTIFVSPYSAAMALQMAVNGAAGETRTEMERALEIQRISLPKINEASKAAAASHNSSNTNVILTTANALWYREGAGVKPAFLDANQQFFSSTVKALDFRNAPAAEAVINQWASDQTHGRITGIANGLIDPTYTDLVLANTIYFKGRWLDPFDKALTKERPFHPAAGPVKNRAAMEKSKEFSYRKGTEYQAVRLPYMGYNLAMYVFLPNRGSSPEKLLKIMNGDNWRRVTIPGFDHRKGRVVLPKFKLENTLELKASLVALGMRQAFDSKTANFSEMFADRHHISDVRQKAFVEVNEEGTEAAAVTAIAAPEASAVRFEPPKPFEMIVDRPFLFAIVDDRTQMILFMGLVEDL